MTPSPSTPCLSTPSLSNPRVPHPRVPSPCPTRPCAVVDLTAHREQHDRAVSAVAAAPVRHLPAALLDALMGSWGTPQELLGTDRPVAEARLAR